MRKESLKISLIPEENRDGKCRKIFSFLHFSR